MTRAADNGSFLRRRADLPVMVLSQDYELFFHRSGNMAVMSAIAIAFLWMADGDSKLFTSRQRAWLTSLATVVIVFTGLQNRGGMVSASVTRSPTV